VAKSHYETIHAAACLRRVVHDRHAIQDQGGVVAHEDAPAIHAGSVPDRQVGHPERHVLSKPGEHSPRSTAIKSCARMLIGGKSGKNNIGVRPEVADTHTAHLDHIAVTRSIKDAL
jgi:hypothetical protein